jgi:hypothetical protein
MRAAQRMSELQRYFVMSDSWFTALFGHSWHIFDNEARLLAIV